MTVFRDSSESWTLGSSVVGLGCIVHSCMICIHLRGDRPWVPALCAPHPHLNSSAKLKSTPGRPRRKKADALKGLLCNCGRFALGIDIGEAAATAGVTWVSHLVLAVA